MKTVFENLQNGNKVTQAKVFVLTAIPVGLTLLLLNALHVIHLHIK